MKEMPETGGVILPSEQFRRRKAALYTALFIVFILAFWLLPSPGRLVLDAVVIGYALWGAWSIWPRPCAICGRRMLSNPVPRQPRRVRTWWDLRYPPRDEVIWVCSLHLPAFLGMQANQRAREARRSGDSSSSDAA